jgi:hypothetical protein
MSDLQGFVEKELQKEIVRKQKEGRKAAQAAAKEKRMRDSLEKIQNLAAPIFNVLAYLGGKSLSTLWVQELIDVPSEQYEIRIHSLYKADDPECSIFFNQYGSAGIRTEKGRSVFVSRSSLLSFTDESSNILRTAIRHIIKDGVLVLDVQERPEVGPYKEWYGFAINRMQEKIASDAVERAKTERILGEFQKAMDASCSTLKDQCARLSDDFVVKTEKNAAGKEYNILVRSKKDFHTLSEINIHTDGDIFVRCRKVGHKGGMIQIFETSLKKHGFGRMTWGEVAPEKLEKKGPTLVKKALRRIIQSDEVELYAL